MRTILLTAIPALLAACASTPRPGAPVTSAGDLVTTARPDRSDADLAALRARGPLALDELLDAYARQPSPSLAATIDRVAGQRYATVSRLYWYTDLAAAQREARRTGKPILSLRMLGRLDEDLSCANSRFFRTVLYANAELSRFLRDSFVLHWSSERPVPRITIDFGDGRRLERTVTGNSAHYVLDGDGRVVDVLPGLYAPAVFRAELEADLALAAALAPLDPPARTARLAAWHHDRADERDRAWAAADPAPYVRDARRLADAADLERQLERSERRAITKAFIEVPDLSVVDFHVSPAAIGDDVARWAAIGQRLYGLGGASRPIVHDPLAAWIAPAPRELLDAQSRALITAVLQPVDASLPRRDLDAVLARLEQTLVADTAQNEMVLHQAIRRCLAVQPGLGFEALNAWIYAEVFHTPASDPWLGLLPGTAFSGLPGDGVVTPGTMGLTASARPTTDATTPAGQIAGR